jgi:mRNA-degrading endonuclease RelE of RelBE toxin-antitoxin system
LADAVIRFLDGPLSDSPERVTKPLRGELHGARSGSIGVAYRVLVRIDSAQRIVYVLRIAHRADVYRP